MNEDYNHYKYRKYKTKYLESRNRNESSRKVRRIESHIVPTYQNEHLSEPWFTLISMGLKTVEGRRNKGKYKDMKFGDVIEWVNEDFNKRSVMTRVTEKNSYPTFKEYLETEGLENCLPGISSITDGLSVYFKYYTPKDEEVFGVVAIKLELVG